MDTPQPTDFIAEDIASGSTRGIPAPREILDLHKNRIQTVGRFGKCEIETSAYFLLRFLAKGMHLEGRWVSFFLSDYLTYLKLYENELPIPKATNPPDKFLYGLTGPWFSADGISSTNDWKYPLLVSLPDGKFAVTRYFVECCMAK